LIIDFYGNFLYWVMSNTRSLFVGSSLNLWFM
jgi:hypothetical protein